MKNLAKVGLSLALLLGLASCGNATDTSSKESTEKDSASKTTESVETTKEEATGGQTIKVGVVGENNEVWEDVARRYEEGTGNKIEIVAFSEYNEPNEALNSGDIDLNAFQHKKFLANYNETNGTDLVEIADTYLAPLGIYSSKTDTLDDLEEGDTVAIPDDSSNGARALFLLQAAGFIKVEGKAGDPITVADIVENPKNIEIVELAASQTARSLDDVKYSVINSGMAVDAGFIPTEDAIFLEDANNPDSKIYINVIAARKDDADNELYKDLIENYYYTDETKAVSDKATKGSSIPVWD